jgi:hypothetical protein
MSDKEAILAERYASLEAKRFEDETFEEYKLRMRTTKKMLRAYLRGRRMTSEEYEKSN